jgi:hypothetical protein
MLYYNNGDYDYDDDDGGCSFDVLLLTIFFSLFNIDILSANQSSTTSTTTK